MPSDAAISILLSHTIPWMLVLVRISGVFIAAPMIGSLAIPMRFRVLIAVAMSAAAYPALASASTAAPAAPVIQDVITLFPMLLSELLIGFAIGAIASLPLLAMEASGVIMGQSIGFGLARVYNPESDTDTDLLGQLLFYIASGLFFTMGGLEMLFTTLLSTFSRVPPGGFAVGMLPLETFVAVLASGFELALRVALPVVGIVLLIALILGAVSKTMPQINVMSVGFTIKMLAGLTVLATALYVVGDAVDIEVRRTLTIITTWTESLGTPDPLGPVSLSPGGLATTEVR